MSTPSCEGAFPDVESLGRSSLLGLAVALFAAAQGCNRCSTKNRPNEADAAPPVPSATAVESTALLPPPVPWSFRPLRVGPGMPSFALPDGCTLRESTVVARVAPSSKFVATPLGTGSLVVADVDPKENPPKLVGVAGVLLDPQGSTKETAPLPWLEATAMPRIARSAQGAWLAAYTETEEEAPSAVFVFQNKNVTPLGEGDRFEAVDMSCGKTRCALLATRKGSVLASGASVYVGGADEPASAWKALEIIPGAGDATARPSVLARVDVSVVATLFEGRELVFVDAEAAPGGRELGRVAAPHGLIDATMTDGPLALVYGAEIDDEGCAREGGKIHIARPGKDPIELRAHAPPSAGALRPLSQGTFAAYLTPLGCGQARKVAYAVLLDSAANPISAPMPVADAQSFAVAADGDKVDIWLQQDDTVTWLRATCGAPPAAPR